MAKKISKHKTREMENITMEDFVKKYFKPITKSGKDLKKMMLQCAKERRELIRRCDEQVIEL